MKRITPATCTLNTLPPKLNQYLYAIGIMLIFLTFMGLQCRAQIQGIGPFGGPDYQGKHSNGTGQIDCIAFHPNYNVPCKPDSLTLFIGSPYGGLWKSVDGGNNWSVVDAVQHLAFNSVEDIEIVTDPATNKAVIYIATGSPSTTGKLELRFPSCGIYKSLDMGATFQPIGNFNENYKFDYIYNKRTTHIAVSPTDARLIFAATSDGLYRTADGGMNWELVLCNDHPEQSATPGIFSVKFGVKETNTVYASGKYVYCSKQKGAQGTFSKLNEQLIDSIANHYQQAGKGNVRYSEINSDITVASKNGIDNIYWHLIFVLNYDPGGTFKAEYIGSCSSLPGAAPQWLTYNYGKSQFFYEASVRLPDRVKIDVNPLKPDMIMAGSTQTQYLIWDTSAQGKIWKNVTGYSDNGHGDIHAIQFAPHENAAFVGTDGGLYKVNFNNTGKVDSIREKNDGLSVSTVFAVACSNKKQGKIVIGKQDTNFDFWDGKRWWQGSSGGDGYPPVVFNPANENDFWVGINFDVSHYSFNNGAFKKAAPVRFCGAMASALGFLLYDPGDSEKIYAGQAYGKNFYDDDLIDVSTDGGKTFRRLTSIGKRTGTSPGDMSHSPRCGAVTTSSPAQLYVATNSFGIWDNPHLYVIEPDNFNLESAGDCSKDMDCIGSGSCQEELDYIPPLKNPDIYPFGPDAQNENNESNLKYPRWQYPVSSIALSDKMMLAGKRHKVSRPQQIWVSIDYGDWTKTVYQVRRSDNGGITWKDDNTGLPPGAINKLVYVNGSDGEIYAGTAVGTIYYKNNSMTSWRQVYADLPHSVISDMCINYTTRQLVIATFGRGVFLADLYDGK